MGQKEKKYWLVPMGGRKKGREHWRVGELEAFAVHFTQLKLSNEFRKSLASVRRTSRRRKWNYLSLILNVFILQFNAETIRQSISNYFDDGCFLV